jgi:hypothetical protein
LISHSFRNLLDIHVVIASFSTDAKRQHEMLLADVVSSSYPSQPWSSEGGDRRLRSFYNSNLVYALSKTLKSNVAAVVKAVDLYLIEERQKTVLPG